MSQPSRPHFISSGCTHTQCQERNPHPRPPACMHITTAGVSAIQQNACARVLVHVHASLRKRGTLPHGVCDPDL
jgi:hypothetical protein